MPIYEFECCRCNSVVEELLFLGQSFPSRCTCGGTLSKIMSQTAPERTKWPLKKRRTPPELKKFNL